MAFLGKMQELSSKISFFGCSPVRDPSPDCLLKSVVITPIAFTAISVAPIQGAITHNAPLSQGLPWAGKLSTLGASYRLKPVR